MSVLLEGPAPAQSLPDAAVSQLVARAEHLLSALGHPEAELSLSLVTDDEIAWLNERHRGKARPTDVLSYSLVEGDHNDFRGRLLGDVVISVETAQRQAADQNVSVEAELLRLLIHGLLHLLGHDHEEEAEALRMRALEEQLWQEMAP